MILCTTLLQRLETRATFNKLMPSRTIRVKMIIRLSPMAFAKAIETELLTEKMKQVLQQFVR